MTINYTVNNKQMASVRYVGQDAEDFVKGRYKSLYEAALYIFKKIYKISFINKIELVNKSVYFSLLESITLEVTTAYGVLTLVLSDNKFTILNDMGYTSFYLEPVYPGNELTLEKFADYQKSRDVLLEFSLHNLKIEIHFNKSGRVFYLEVPMDSLSSFDLKFLSALKENGDIKDLYKFYCRTLKPKQHQHYINEYITTLSIWQKIDSFQDCSTKGIKLDEILLKCGFTQNYQLGNIHFDTDGEPVIMILRDGAYTITGYNSNKCNLDIGEQVQLLERRKQELS